MDIVLSFKVWSYVFLNKTTVVFSLGLTLLPQYTLLIAWKSQIKLFSVCLVETRILSGPVWAPKFYISDILGCVYFWSCTCIYWSVVSWRFNVYMWGLLVSGMLCFCSSPLFDALVTLAFMTPRLLRSTLADLCTLFGPGLKSLLQQ